MRKVIRKIINNFFNGYAVVSYSQEGEDMILRRIFEKKENEFYVDVGAFHPKRFSNTHYFYKKGWHGINIDATPDSMKLFRILRSRDINIECGVARQREKLIYYIYNDPALNNSDANLVRLLDRKMFIRS